MSRFVVGSLVLIGLLGWPQMLTAKTFGQSDYESIVAWRSKIRAVSDDLVQMIRVPPGRDPSGHPDRAFLDTQECMIRLSGTVSVFDERLRNISTLIGIAGQMVDAQDEKLVVRLIQNSTKSFVELAKLSQQEIRIVEAKCRRDAATIAKVPEIVRLFGSTSEAVRLFGDKANSVETSR